MSIAGVAAPANPTGTFLDEPDVSLPASSAGSATVVVEAKGVPAGTRVKVVVSPATGAASISETGALSGDLTLATGSAFVNLPAGMSVVTATAYVDVSDPATALVVEGERVVGVELAAGFGGASDAVYVLRSGKRVHVDLSAY